MTLINTLTPDTKKDESSYHTNTVQQITTESESQDTIVHNIQRNIQRKNGNFIGFTKNAKVEMCTNHNSAPINAGVLGFRYSSKYTSRCSEKITEHL